MKRSLLIFTAGLLAVAGSLQSCKNGGSTGKAVTLKMKLQPGTQYVYEMDTKTAMNVSGLSTTQSINSIMTFAVAAGEGTDKQLTVSYEKLSSEMNTPMGVIKFNSDDPNLNGMKGVLSQPFTMTIAENGTIKKIEGLERTESATTAEEDDAMKQVKATLTDSAIRTSMSYMLDIYPDNPVKPGDTWMKKTVVSLAGVNIRVENNFKLLGVDKQTAHIEVKSKITEGKGEMSMVKVDLKGKSEGVMDVDTETGFMTSSKIKQDIDGMMSMGTKSAPLKMNVEMTTSGKKK